MARDLVIYGAGGFAREVSVLVADINQAGTLWNLLGYLADAPSPGGQTHVATLGGPEWLDKHPSCSVVIGIGSPQVRRRVAKALISRGVDTPALVHPSVGLNGRLQIGRGTLITAGNVLTTDIELGEFVILNLACTTGHDVRLGEFVTIAPGVNISGNVVIEDGSDVGTGAAVIQGVTIGEWSIVGAGAVVTKDLPPNCTAVGAPAKPIKFREPGWQLH